MGEEITKDYGNDSGKINAAGSPGTGTGRSGSTAAAAGSNSGSGGTGTGTGTGTGKTEEKKPAAVAILTDEEQKKKDEKNAKRRQAYAKKKAEGTNAKPKKVNKKKNEELPLDTESLKTLVLTISALIASRPDCEHWLLSEKEVESIITPLQKMLADSELFKGAGAYSNQIALVIACITIFVPRLFITVNKANEKKKRKVTGNETDTTVKPGTDIRTAKTETNGTTGTGNRPVATGGKNNANSISWAGSPIA